MKRTNSARAGSKPRSSASELPRRSIDLDIAGGDMMLQGHFADWESGLAVGPDLDQVGVKLAIDATSVAAPRRDEEASGSLFAFHSREVEQTGPASYRAVGTFTGPRGARAMEMEVSSPLGHTALCVVTFAATRQDLGDGWHDLMANVVPFIEGIDGMATRPAHAWLIPPPLATA